MPHSSVPHGSAEIPERPLRVLFTLGSLGGGGAERQLLDLLKHFHRQHIQPSLYLMEERGELLSEVPPDVPVTSWNSPDLRRNFLWKGCGFAAPAATRSFHLWQHLRRHPVDLVVGWMLQSAHEAVWPCWWQGVPLVTSTVVSPVANMETAFPGHSRQKQLTDWTYRNSAHILVNSHELRNETLRFHQLPAEKITAVPNPRDFDQLDRLAAEHLVSSASAGPRLVAVGRLHPQKGYLDLLSALSILRFGPFPELVLEIVGEGPQRPEIEAQIRRLNLQSAVRLHGFLRNPFPILRSAEAFVLASHYEGLPNVLLEAMALGIPVVATNCPTGPQEILENGRWGRLTPVGNPEKLAEAIQHVLSDPTRSLEVAREAAGVIRETYGIQNGVKMLESLLLDVARQSCQPSA